MRKNCKDVIDSWKMNASCKSSQSIWTERSTGEIWSYRTMLLKRYHSVIVFNATKYSRTTTVHQNALRTFFGEYCARCGLTFLVLDDVPMGYRSADCFDESLREFQHNMEAQYA